MLHRVLVATLGAAFALPAVAFAQSEPVPSVHVVMPYSYFAGQGMCAHEFVANYAGASEFGAVSDMTLHIVGYIGNRKASEADLRFPAYDGSRASNYAKAVIEMECVDRFVITRATARIAPDGRPSRPMDFLPMLDTKPNLVPVATARRR